MFIMILFLGVIIFILYKKYTELIHSEHLTATSTSSNEAVQILSSAYNSGKAVLSNLTLTGGLTIGNLTIDPNGNMTTTGSIKSGAITSGDHTINGAITVTNGGNFNGGRYYFNDTENCGKLRVGCAWGNPGIYAEKPDLTCKTCSGDLAIGSYSSNVSLQNGTTTNFVGSHTTSGTAKTTGGLTIGNTGTSDYTLFGGADGFRISTGAANDTNRYWFKRTPGQINITKST